MATRAVRPARAPAGLATETAMRRNWRGDGPAGVADGAPGAVARRRRRRASKRPFGLNTVTAGPSRSAKAGIIDGNWSISSARRKGPLRGP